MPRQRQGPTSVLSERCPFIATSTGSEDWNKEPGFHFAWIAPGGSYRWLDPLRWPGVWPEREQTSWRRRGERASLEWASRRVVRRSPLERDGPLVVAASGRGRNDLKQTRVIGELRRQPDPDKAWQFAGPCIYGTSRPRYGMYCFWNGSKVAETGSQRVCMSMSMNV